MERDTKLPIKPASCFRQVIEANTNRTEETVDCGKYTTQRHLCNISWLLTNHQLQSDAQWVNCFADQGLNVHIFTAFLQILALCIRILLNKEVL